THPRNLIDFTQPHEPAAQKGRVEVTERRYRLGVANLKKAKAAGVPFLPGTDTGFAITPYGEWHARELELFVEDLGFTPAAALRDRFRADQLDRSLHPGARRRIGCPPAPSRCRIVFHSETVRQ